MIKKIKYSHIPESKNRSFQFDHVHIYWSEQITFHEQETWELSYIITGSGTRIIGDTIEPFSRNEVVLIPPNIPHCWYFDQFDADENGKIENISIEFSNTFLDNCSLTFPELIKNIERIKENKGAISFKGSTLENLSCLLLSMLTQSIAERVSSFIRLITLISSSENTNTVGKSLVEDKKSKRMQKVLLYIMNNYQNSITLDEMSQLVNLDKSSFCIFFKKMTTKTFFTYLTEYRIESSCQMIQKTNMSIAEICFASGFNDVPYYNRVFKKLKNITPSEYRRVDIK